MNLRSAKSIVASVGLYQRAFTLELRLDCSYLCLVPFLMHASDY